MTNLFVTIPAYNEEKTLPDVIKSIPGKIKGIRKVKIIVWSDGSTDKTASVAKKSGADYVFESKKNLGLAKTFDLITQKAVELGADIVVNTDADNQYDQREIAKLIKPILAGKADIVSGDRQVEGLTHMPASKKWGNIIGSWTIRMLSGLSVKDASSGFRAYTKEAINSFNLLSTHTYTHETLIQAANKDLVVVEVPIKFKKRKTGGSRLISGVFPHIKKSMATIIRTILMYKAFKFFVVMGVMTLLVATLLVGRFLYFYSLGDGSGHIQSLIIASILFSLGFNVILIGVIADLISINRKLMERK